MIYALIIAFTILIAVVLLALTREKGYESVTRGGITIRELASNLRNPDIVGVSPKINRARARLKRGYNCTVKKVENGEDLYEFERILYENYFQVFECIKRRDYKYFQALPHKFNKARIEIIADYIVSNSLPISAESIENAIRDFNSYTTLHIDEVSSLQQAIKLALLRSAANISGEISEFRKMKKRAEQDEYLSISRARNACYLYWRKLLGKSVTPKELTRTDINIDNIEYEFSAQLIDYGKRMANIVSSLKNLKNIFTMRFTLGLSDTHNLLLSDSVYNMTDENAQIAFLRLIEKYSFDYEVPERAIVDACMELERKSGESFLEFLFRRRILKAELKGKPYGTVQQLPIRLMEWLHIAVVYGINAVVSALLGALTMSVALGIPIALLSFLALLKPIEFVVMNAYRTIMSSRPTPRLDVKDITDEHATLVVVPHYISDADELKIAVENLKILRAGNSGENIDFALLIDFKRSDEPIMEYELEWIQFIEKALSDYTDMNYFVRRKTKIGNGYSGRERKRGAIEEMNDMLIAGNRSCFTHVMREPRRYEYVMVLDADSKVLPDTVKQAVNTISHPLNAKYDLMAFDNAYNAFTMRSLYAKQYYYASGHECYHAHGDYFYDFIARAVFSGKGIYRLNTFQEKLCGVLPENRVLSHDIIEGAIVNTGALGLSVFEDAPNTIMSDTDRRNRWLRGDTQLLEFIGGRFKNKSGKRVKVDYEPIYGYLMANNFMKAIGETALLALLLIALFLPSFVNFLPFVIGVALIPLVQISEYALKGNKGMRLRYVRNAIIAKITDTVLNILILPFYAINNLFVVIKSILSLLTHGGLKWRTFSMSQRNLGFKSFLLMIAPTLAFLIIIGCVGYANPLVIAYTAISYAVIIALYPVNVEFKREKLISKSQKEELLSIARKTFNYFRSAETAIVPDNYQVKPYIGWAKNTSPTNIGLSMIAEISAYELGIIDLATAEKRINKVLESVVKLEKYRGHLYNWYNAETTDVMAPKYVSSVDSGNFLASLIATRQFLLKNSLRGAEIAKRLIDDTDLDALFDKENGLYYIGYNTDTDSYDGHYDMLASEARILYYVSAGINRNTVGWNNLSRDVVGNHGNILMSWSGTMFEYLMPNLFMKGSEYGLLERTNQGAVMAQKLNKCNGLWGISECGYYKFDSSMRYQYHAFGLSVLAKRNENNRCVVAPYASILALEYAPKAVIENITLMRERGGLGDMGYYESLDYTSGINVVRSHMAHHQGMIMAAIANYLADGAIRKLFMLDDRMKSSEILLTERNVMKRTAKREKTDFIYDKKIENNDYEYTVDPDNIVTNLFGNGRYSVVVSNNGVGYSIYDGNLINKFRYGSGIYGIIPTFECDGKTVSPIKAISEETCSNVIYGVNETSFVGENCRMNIYVPHCINGELREFSWLNHTNTRKNVKTTIYMDLSLSRYDDDVSHPIFNDMFISTEFHKEYNAVIAERKSRDNGDSLYLAFCVIGDVKVNFDTNKYNFIGRNGNIINRNSNDKFNAFGDSLYPCIGAEVIIDTNPNSLSSFYVLVSVDKDKESLLERLKLTKDKNYTDFLIDSARVMSLSCVKNYDLTPSEFKLAHSLAAHILYSPYNTDISNYNINALYNEVGLRGDIKTLLLEYDNDLDYLISAVRIVKYLNATGISVNLLIVLKNSNIYYDKVNAELSKMIDGNIKVAYAPIKPDYYRTAFMTLNGLKIPDLVNKKPIKSLEIVENSPYNSRNSQNISKSGAISFKSGSGGFAADSYYVLEKPLLPYSYVLAGKKGGTIVTENGGGYTYFENSREYKLTEWNNSPVDDKPSERLYLIKNDKAYRVNQLINGFVKYDGTAVYSNTVEQLAVDVEECMICDGAVKAYRINLKNLSDKSQNIELIFDTDFIADWKASPSHMVYDIDVVSKVTNVLSGLSVYFTALGDYYTCETKLINASRILEITEGLRCIKRVINIASNATQTEIVLMSMDKEAILSVKRDNINDKILEERNKVNRLKTLKLSSNNYAIDALFNRLTYQVSASRLTARAGYYQAGGAVGFRDQLQDSLTLLYSDPERVREIILYCAHRQFIEGDVLHWWHASNKGVRTKISDDKLFLPYVVCEYIAATGDRNILNENISYLKGALLKDREESAYSDYEVSEVSETLLMHCKRAIDSALKHGEHGLLLIGAGDWNDALNGIGLQGKGESVWLSMFAYMVIEKFIELLPSGMRLKYLETNEKLKKAIDDSYNGAWYRRAFTDDGKWLGDSTSEVCKIDLLCQAFAVLSGTAKPKKAESAINSALEMLVDKDKRIIKLLTPPFDFEHYYGYISAYPKGVRENGGQYTHAAMWFLIALCRLKRYDEAFELFRMINPVEKCANESDNNIYMGEPYVLSGDVYASGQMGWSWYTGSASWAFKLIMEEFLGVRVKGEWLEVYTPRIKNFDNMRLEYQYKSTIYSLSFVKSDRRRVSLDGVNYSGGRIPLKDDGKQHECYVAY